MKKIYIVPESIINEVHGRTALLGRGDVNINAHSNATTFELSAGKERDGGDMNFVSGSDEGASTGGFGSDAGPWELLW